MKTELTMLTEDGVALAATLFSPSVSPKAGIVINSATAVRQSFYHAFAAFLCGQGFLVLTYDYRGIGGSALSSPRDKRLSMKAWGELDLAAVLHWTQQEHGHLEWHCIGHSVGGQVIGLAKNNTLLKSVYCVSAQSGYWNHWPPLHKLRMLAMWYAVVPGLSILLGQVPGQFLGGEALPEGVARQWAYWGRHPDYIVDAAGRPIRDGFERLACDMKFLLIDDDKAFAPPAAVGSLSGFYANANTEVETISARRGGPGPVGHFGFFRKHHEQGLWQHALSWLQAHTTGEVQQASA